jgi:very-long-chain (3R)-3-hydroxyacyl-CoA dehydratase
MPQRKSSPTNLQSAYLLGYNALSFALWATCTLRLALLVPLVAPHGHLPAVFTHLFSPLLTTTQSLAVLEIVHAGLGVVRAPVGTTALQVASRLLVVWGVLFPFRAGSGLGVPGAGIVGGQGAAIGDVAFVGCLAAWGMAECVRYGFFALQAWGQGVPVWWMWLR